MHPEDIKASLRKLGITEKGLAQELEVDHSAISHIIRGRSRSKRIEEAIAQKIGKPLWKVFPKHYRKSA